MPPLPINPTTIRLFADRVRDLAMQAAKEAAKAANKEAAVEFIEELAKELAKELATELATQLAKRFPDLFKGAKEEDREDPTAKVLDGFSEADGKGPAETAMEGVKDHGESIDEIIFNILYGDRNYEPQLPPLAEVKDQEAERTQLPVPDVMTIDGDSDKEETSPIQDDRVEKLHKELESLQKEWMALTLAQATENHLEDAPQGNCKWKWILIGGIAVILVVGGAVYLWYQWCGGNGGGGNGGGGAGEDGGDGVVLLGQEQNGGEEVHGQVAQYQAAADQAAAAHPAGPVGLQILLYASGLPSGQLLWRRLGPVDRLVPAAMAIRKVGAAHPVALALPAATAINPEALEETVEVVIIEELLKQAFKGELNGGLEIAHSDKKFAEKYHVHVTDYMKSEVAAVAACLKDRVQEFIRNLPQDKEGKIMVEENIPKLCKFERVTQVARSVGTTLCV